ncbi:MAG: hypothetical protein SFW67_12960 [Myxococcaceae bacterium]|nr:hypothetical protein [Myxococcaceae bacterium]
MRAAKPERPAPKVAPRVEKPNESGDLGEALRTLGVSSAELFGWQKVAFRRVEAVSASHVALDFTGRAVAVPRGLVPGAKVDQWVRFEKGPGGSVRASVDLRATLKAEARLSDLFVALGR